LESATNGVRSNNGSNRNISSSGAAKNRINNQSETSKPSKTQQMRAVISKDAYQGYQFDQFA
jgi:hypothetical protein